MSWPFSKSLSDQIRDEARRLGGHWVQIADDLAADAVRITGSDRACDSAESFRSIVAEVFRQDGEFR